MTFTRRAALIGGAATIVTALGAAAAPPARIAAVAFDALALFDTRSIASLAKQLFAEKAEPLLALWRTRQFEYTWLRTLSGTYEDFWRVTEQSLVFAAA